jgi:hypothetical protein
MSKEVQVLMFQTADENGSATPNDQMKPPPGPRDSAKRNPIPAKVDFFGPIPSSMVGGLGTLAVAAICAVLFAIFRGRWENSGLGMAALGACIAIIIRNGVVGILGILRALYERRQRLA